MPVTLWLLPVSLGGNPWQSWLPPAQREVACRVTHFVVENAKSARAELKLIGHPVPIRELRIVELPARLDAESIDRLLAPLTAGQDIAIMSEAGCPGVADPGATLVMRAHELGFAVHPMVGPSSILLTLMASGLDGQRFAFHGYVPTEPGARGNRLLELERESTSRNQTQIVIETPYRNGALFKAMIDKLRGATRLCVATDLTLPSQSIVTQNISRWKSGPAPDLDRRPTVFAFQA